MLSHTLEHGVLVITVDQDPGIAGRATLTTHITHLVDAHQPTPVVIVLAERAAGPAAVSAVLRAHQWCARLGVLMCVVAHSAPVRRLLEDNADTSGPRLVVHARVDTAVSTAFTAAVQQPVRGSGGSHVSPAPASSSASASASGEGV